MGAAHTHGHPRVLGVPRHPGRWKVCARLAPRVLRRRVLSSRTAPRFTLSPAKGADDASLTHCRRLSPPGIRLPGLNCLSRPLVPAGGVGWTTGHLRNTHECGWCLCLPCGARAGLWERSRGGCRAVVPKTTRVHLLIHSFLGDEPLLRAFLVARTVTAGLKQQRLQRESPVRPVVCCRLPASTGHPQRASSWGSRTLTLDARLRCGDRRARLGELGVHLPAGESPAPILP